MDRFEAADNAARGAHVSADALLSRLDKVKSTGRSRWLACCPAHDDRKPSLAVRELSDGRLLAHCFSGCPVEAVVAAIGLDMSDLFPDSLLGVHKRRDRKPYSVRDLVACLRHELLVCWTILSAVHRNQPLDADDRARAGVAVDRILNFIGELDHAA